MIVGLAENWNITGIVRLTPETTTDDHQPRDTRTGCRRTGSPGGRSRVLAAIRE